MAIYASSHTRGTQRVDVVSLGAISAPQLSLAHGQMFVAQALRPKAGRAEAERGSSVPERASRSAPI